jgi:uncharacterized protein (UPF0216 family)
METLVERERDRESITNTAGEREQERESIIKHFWRERERGLQTLLERERESIRNTGGERESITKFSEEKVRDSIDTLVWRKMESAIWMKICLP